MYSIGDNMKINKTRFLQIALFLLAGILICFSAEARNGAALGLTLAQKVVIPSLLPLLIIFNFLQELAASKQIAGTDYAQIISSAGALLQCRAFRSDRRISGRSLVNGCSL